MANDTCIVGRHVAGGERPVPMTSSEMSRPRPGQRTRAADRTDAPHGSDAVLPEPARSSSFCPPPRRGGDGQLLPAASRQSLGDFPVILRNSRLKFDRVLNPLESMAVVTASPASRLSQALSIRKPLT